MTRIRTTSFPGPTVESDTGPKLYFGGTAYLGLQADPEFQELLIRNIRLYGTSYGASRKSNLHFPVFEEAEARLAAWIGCDAAITLSSGYLACQLVRQSLRAAGHDLLPLPGSHSALSGSFDDPPLISDIQQLETAIERSLSASRVPALLLDSIDFRGDRFPRFDELKALPLEQLILVVDDSHGFGVVGAGGRGSAAALRKLGAKELIICGSLNKGLALQAGLISGSRERIDQLANTAVFAGASPTAPAIMATFLDAQALYPQRHSQLRENIASFLHHVSQVSLFEYNQGHAAFSIAAPGLSERLEGEGILVTRFDYPAQAASAINRIVLTAAHRPEAIRQLAATVNAFSAPSSSPSKPLSSTD